MKLHTYLLRLAWLFFLPILVLAAYLVYVSLEEVERYHEEAVGRLAINTALAFDHHLQSRIWGLQLLVRIPDIDRLQLDEFYEAAQAFRASFGQHVVLADAEGRMILNTRVPFGASLPGLPEVKGHSAARAALATGKPAVGDQFVGPVSGERMVAAAAPVVRQGQVVRLLFAAFEARDLQRRLDDLVLADGWGVVLRDGTGETIARRGADIPAPTVRRSAPVKLARWTVEVTAPAATLGKSGGAHRTVVVFALALAAFALLAAIGSGFAARRLGRALASLGAGPEAAAETQFAEIEAIRQRLAELDRQRQADAAALRDDEGRLQRSERQLHALAARLLVVREEERARLAREVHDELGQQLTGLSMDVAWLGRRCAASDDIELKRVTQGRLDEMARQLEGMIGAVQEIVSALRPSALDGLGLGAALRFEAGRFQARSGIACTADIPDDLPEPPGETSTALFRIVQECLTNVARHSAATCVDVHLAATDDGLALEVRDNGRGIAPEQIGAPASLGLLGMRERAAQLGGSFAIEGEPGAGTTVRVWVPR